MKIAVIGTGKTGHTVVDALPNDAIVGPFNTRNPPTAAALDPADAVVVFVPGDVFPSLIPIFLQARKPTIIGSTGIKWPQDLHDTLVRHHLTWIFAPNFSLGMILVYRALLLFRRTPALLPDATFSIHEVHHTHKKDAPSGTAIAWQQTLHQPCPITFSREGDVKGIHTLTITTDRETIALRHETLDRSVFAEGALWSARQLVEKKFCEPGLHTFEDLADTILQQVTS